MPKRIGHLAGLGILATVCLSTAVAAEDASSRYAEACEKAARTALVGSFDFNRTGVDDRTAAGEAWVDVRYDAVSKNTGRVYPQVFSCAFHDLADPQNIVLDQALQTGKPYDPASLRALNKMLQAEGFQAPSPR